MLTDAFVSCLQSDQCYAWSGEYTKRVRCCPAQTPQRSGAPVAAAAIDSARFPYRAIQAMRQTGMQVRRRSRTWPQVLFVGELSEAAAADGLRTAGGLRPGGGVFGQLSPDPRDSGTDLRDQPRVAAPSRSTLKERHERIAGRPVCCDRCASGRRSSGQHARRLAGCKPGEFALCGGRR